MSPTRPTIALLTGWLVLGLVASFEPALTPVWAWAGGALAIVATVDGIAAVRLRPPRVSRRVAPALSVGVPTRIELTIENPGARTLRLEITDHPPAHARTAGLPIALQVQPGRRVECAYRIWAGERGDHRFEPAEVRLRSPLGLWHASRRCGVASDVRAYPNFRAAVGYELLAAENRIGALGIRRRRRRGEGLEFHQLREYRASDSLRQIDWKATSRLQRTGARRRHLRGRHAGARSQLQATPARP